MTKRAHNLKPVTGPAIKRKRRLVNIPSRTNLQSQQMSQADAQPMRAQAYSSADQALTVLVEGIVGKLGDSPHEQHEMAEFLNMLLDTDPSLREEVLEATTIRK